MRANAIKLTVEIAGGLTFLILPLFMLPVVAPMAAEAPIRPVMNGIVLIHSMIVAYYFVFSYYALPRFYFPGKKAAFAALTLTMLLIILLVPLADNAYNPFAHASFRYPVLLFELSILARFMMITFIAFAIATNARLRKAEEDRLLSELAFLKAQVKPHFLFNTLNSIYALAVTRSANTPTAIVQLAAIMRYMLHEAQAEQVKVRDELASLTAYIELEKLRLTENVVVSCEITGHPEEKKVTPLLLLPIIENAFKHGVSTDAPCEIVIKGKISENTLAMEVRNTKRDSTSRPNGGVGLSNVRRRLSLLPGSNDLEIRENEGIFSVKIQLALS